MALLRITARRRTVLPATRAFSSSSSYPPFRPPPPPANDPEAAQSPSSSSSPNPGAPRNPASSAFQDIRDSLHTSPASPSPPRIPTNLPRPNPSRGAPPSQRTPEDIRRMILNFRSTGGVPSTSSPGAASSPSAPGASPLFADLFKNASVAQGPNAGQGVLGLDAVRGSLKAPRSSKPLMTPLPSSTFRPELERNSKAVGAGQEEKGSAIALKRHYSHEELGKRLGELRPVGAGKDGKEWFSLTELQGRIAKLAELEKQEYRFASATARHPYSELRSGIENLQKQRKPAPLVNMSSLLNLGGQLDYMDRPPQEELLEKYFHPDHMSSEEKMKLELQRVRDEFKMSENDCGSARVQSKLTLFCSS